MSREQAEAILADAAEPARTALRQVRAVVERLVPDAELTIGYGIPCFKLGGQGVAGLGITGGDVAYYPMSGSVTSTLAQELAGYATSKGSVRLPVAEPMPVEIIEKLVATRLAEIAARAKR